MPFGLKVAPSLFQKAMLRIFQPILNNALIYIDDILLYFSDEESHQQLLQEFYLLLKKYGIMLSAKKMILNTSKIEFLRMEIKNGRYSLQPHICQKLLDFPESNLTKQQVQQFLGLVNYITPFVKRLSSIIKPLQMLLQKNPPPWTYVHTTAIQTLNQFIQI